MSLLLLDARRSPTERDLVRERTPVYLSRRSAVVSGGVSAMLAGVVGWKREGLVARSARCGRGLEFEESLLEVKGSGSRLLLRLSCFWMLAGKERTSSMCHPPTPTCVYQQSGRGRYASCSCLTELYGLATVFPSQCQLRPSCFAINSCQTRSFCCDECPQRMGNLSSMYLVFSRLLTSGCIDQACLQRAQRRSRRVSEVNAAEQCANENRVGRCTG